ncbi:MAG: hypothetical protein Q8J85_07200 [Sulfuricurvum sp.]|nr:hypothetical protein [Sulfuricurvum sp.]MDP3022987.1 hypothetical protein [Sulfuricurvum sp.]
MNIELTELDLNYYSTGIEKKIHQSIRDNMKEHITYKNFTYNQMLEHPEYEYRSEYNPKNQTYKVAVKWEYNLNNLIRFFKTNNTVMYKRKFHEFDNQKYLNILLEIKRKLDEPKRLEIIKNKLIEVKSKSVNTLTLDTEIKFY